MRSSSITHKQVQNPFDDVQDLSITAAAADPDARSREGRVCWKSTGRYGVTHADTMIACTLSSKLRKQLVFPHADPTSIRRRVKDVRAIQEVDPIAVGDHVRYVPALDQEGVIIEVLPRINKLARRAAGPKPLEQVIAANIDQVLPIVSAAQPAPNWELLDRYLAAAASGDLPAVIVLTKTDLLPLDALQAEVETYTRIGYQVVLTSTLTSFGMDGLRALVRGRVSVLFGMSGVGKTSLLNALEPGLGLRVGAVSRAVQKGTHTTTHLEMFALVEGGAVIDTPGMREFGLWAAADQDLANTFLEMRPYLGLCRFGTGCSHDHEPGCAVKGAVAAGIISARRHASYLKMR